MSKNTVDLYLKNGYILTAEYDEDTYFELYDNWYSGKAKILQFENCSVRAEDISAIEWEQIPFCEEVGE
jgi:ribulose bisphosphate carboxylase small subunit